MRNYWLNTALLISCVLLLLSGCKPVQMVGGSTASVQERESISRQTDSVMVYVHDSVVMYVGDTVTVSRWHTRYRDRWHTRTDTLVVRDSVSVETPIPVYKTTGWQNFQLWCGRILLVLLLGYFLFRLIKRHLKPF